MPFANLFRARKRFSHTSPKEGRKMKNVDDDSPTFVTRAEVDAIVNAVGVALASAELAHSRAGYADGTIATQLERAKREMTGAESTVLARIAKSFDRAISAQRRAEQRRESERGNAYHQIT